MKKGYLRIFGRKYDLKQWEVLLCRSPESNLLSWEGKFIVAKSVNTITKNIIDNRKASIRIHDDGEEYSGRILPQVTATMEINNTAYLCVSFIGQGILQCYDIGRCSDLTIFDIIKKLESNKTTKTKYEEKICLSSKR